jgi:hypothetical protein
MTRKEIDMMKRIDTILFGIMFGGVLPLLFGMITITLWFYFWKNEQIVVYAVLGGVLLGLLLDSLYFTTVRTRIFHLSTTMLVSIYLFYTVCLYGFFMGFPGFNVLLGIVAGYY